MKDFISTWRIELLHPLSVHFPVSLLLLATLVSLIILFLPGKRTEFLSHCRLILILTGVVSAWVAILTGSLAYNVVVREFYDPPLLGEHQLWAFVASIIYSVVAVIDILVFVRVIKRNKFIRVSGVIVMVIGALALGYAGHLGATAVYDYGAGVHSPFDNIP